MSVVRAYGVPQYWLTVIRVTWNMDVNQIEAKNYFEEQRQSLWFIFMIARRHGSGSRSLQKTQPEMVMQMLRDARANL